MVNLDWLAKDIKDCIARFAWRLNGDGDFQRLIVIPKNALISFPPKVKC